MEKAAVCAKCTRHNSVSRAAIHFALLASGQPPPLELSALSDEQLRGVQRCGIRVPSAVRCSSPLSVAIAEATFARFIRQYLAPHGLKRMSGAGRRYLHVVAEAHVVASLAGLDRLRAPEDPRTELLGDSASERLQWLCSVINSLVCEARSNTVTLRVVTSAQMCLPPRKTARPVIGEGSRASVVKAIRGLLCERRVGGVALDTIVDEVVETL